MSVRLPEIEIALSVEFLGAFAKIPQRMQTQVRHFIEGFRRNPAASTFNYEVIRNARDPNLRSVRINDTYRAIVLKPQRGNIYSLLWVDHHDDAYAWARNRIVRVDPALGGLQIVRVTETEVPEGALDSGAETPDTVETVEIKSAVELTHKVPAPPLFEGIDDEAFRRFGVSDDLLKVVRGLRGEQELDALHSRLPDEVYEALLGLAAGYAPDEVWEQVCGDARVPGPVDPTDFDTAMRNPQTLRRFMVVKDDAELTAVLSAPLARWRIFLHPSQRRQVQVDASGPVRVLGGAGTGKTVVAMHRACHLAARVFTGKDDRILFTTFTRNLAIDIAENLNQLCPPTLRGRIEVVSFDQWVRGFLSQCGFDYRLTYDNQAAARRAWELALGLMPSGLGLPVSFYKEEFEKVVLAQGVIDRDGYFRASRTGRGTALRRADRAAIWEVFEEYRRLLAKERLIEPADAMREARRLLEERGDILPYRAVVVDEAQDLGPQAFRLLRQIVPVGRNDLFIVGDAHQRIYGRQVVLSRCGIAVVGRSVTLKINYRTTDEIRRWAVALLEGQPIDDLDGGQDSARGYKSLLHGVLPEVLQFGTQRAELEAVVERLRGLADEAGDLRAVCLVARTRERVEDYRQQLEARGVSCQVLDKQGDDPSRPGLRLATMHRVKGLEFDHVLVVGVNAGVMPPDYVLGQAADEVAREEIELAERALLYVAATRARRSVLVTSFGAPSALLPGAGGRLLTL